MLPDQVGDVVLHVRPDGRRLPGIVVRLLLGQPRVVVLPGLGHVLDDQPRTAAHRYAVGSRGSELLREGSRFSWY